MWLDSSWAAADPFWRQQRVTGGGVCRQVGVSFDAAVPGGVTLNGTAPQGHGFFCMPRHLTLEPDTESERVPPSPPPFRFPNALVAARMRCRVCG